MKKTLKTVVAAVLLTVLVFPFFVFAADNEFPKTNKVGLLLGGILDVFVDDVVPGGEPEYFYAAADMPLALKSGKIDVYLDDELSAIAHCGSYDNIMIDKVVYSDHYGYIFNKNNKELCDKLSEYIVTLRENGKLDELRQIWIDSDDESLKQLKYDDLSAENGTLNIAIAATMPPMIYVKDGKYAGYEVALLVEFCREYGYGAEFSNSDFSSVLASVTSGKSDIGAASISITDERKKSMLFSESHVEANAVSVVRKSSVGANPSVKDFANRRIGLLGGSIHIATAQKFIPDATLHYYNSNTDIAKALDKNRIDAYIVDEPVARLLTNEYEDHSVLTTLEPFSYAYALPKQGADNEKLREQLDNFLYKIKESGLLRKIDEIWFGNDESAKTVDLEKLKNNENIISFAVFDSANKPFVYTKDGRFVGYEVDIMARFCEEYGYGLDITEYTFDDLLSAVDEGKCDVAAGTISVTEQRKEKYWFSVPHYEAGNVLVIKNYNSEVAESNFFTDIKDSFYNTFIKESRWKLFVQGILTTSLVSVLAIVCGTLLAYLLYLLFYKNITVINRAIIAYCEFIEKTPAVVILMILYYIVFNKLDIHAVTVASLGLCMKFSVRVFGLFRIGVGSIGKGQTEAALALGYSPQKAFTRIIFPQAVTRIVSGYKSAVVNLIEETAVVGYVAVQDLTKISDIIRSRTYEAFFPLIVSAIFYVLISVLIIAAVKKIEFGINPKRRKEEDILKGIRR